MKSAAQEERGDTFYLFLPIDNPDTIEGADNDSNVVFGEYSDAVN